MQYVSTRGQADLQNFSQILLGGLASDGGLFLPQTYPQISDAELTAWRQLPYASLAFEVLKKFATDIPLADLQALTAKTYTPQVYCNARAGEDATQITPLSVLERDGDKTLMLQALSNGPTLAFKDMAMQLLGNLFEYTLARAVLRRPGLRNPAQVRHRHAGRRPARHYQKDLHRRRLPQCP